MSSADSPAAAVQAYIDAFNRGDAAAMAACFAAEGSILDGMAPHLWIGPDAATDWYRDVLAEGAHLDAGDYHATLGDPLHDNVTGDAAYFVAPASMTFRFKDRQSTQTGATFTFALRKEGGGWRIAAWAWAKGRAA
jgi:ketosteroid isomerase-like protein